MKNKGITIIALVITIIILIILAGIVINLSLGENGIFNKAKYAKEKYQNSQELESNILSYYEKQIDNIEIANENIERNKLNIESLKNFKLIHHTGIEKNTNTYTIDKDYSLIIIVVSAIGGNSGSENCTTGITIDNSRQELIKLVENERIPYASSKYYSSVTVGYIVKPDIDTVIKTSAYYRGILNIYALGELDENIN